MLLHIIHPNIYFRNIFCLNFKLLITEQELYNQELHNSAIIFSFNGKNNVYLI